MDTLVRSQAIKRAKDIINRDSINHITFGESYGYGYILNDCERGALCELIAIFEIEESELK